MFFNVVFSTFGLISIFLSSCGGQKSQVAAQTEKPASANLSTTNNTGNTNQETIKIASSNSVVERPRIVSRQEWKAKDAIGEGKEHKIRYITIHHTATLKKSGVAIEKKMQSLQSFSQSESSLASGKMKPAWFDIPYHYYIAVDGKIAEGRDIKFAGDTNTNYDPDGHALVVLEGNFETEQPSSEQQESLQSLVSWLSVNYKISVSKIKAHNDYASTACPGVHLKKLLPKLQEKIGEITKVL